MSTKGCSGFWVICKNQKDLVSTHLFFTFFIDNSRFLLILTLATLSKKKLWHRCFSLNFAKFLRTPFFIEHRTSLVAVSVYSLQNTVNLLKMIIIIIKGTPDIKRTAYIWRSASSKSDDSKYCNFHNSKLRHGYISATWNENAAAFKTILKKTFCQWVNLRQHLLWKTA